jgi:hypothetical protein
MKHLTPGYTALLALALMLGTAGVARAQEPNVQLAYAKLQTVCGNVLCNRLVGAVEVKNLASDKQVALAYTTGNGLWSETAASYTALAANGYESWTFTRDVPSGTHVQFALRYTVAGQTYWDHNGGGDYHLGGASAPAFVLGKAAVKLDTAAYESNRLGYYINGTLVVKDLAAAKNVTVVYSTSGFPLNQEQAATYLGDQANTGGSLERWSFSLRLQPSGSTLPLVHFALRYTVNGVTYWDTNLGRYYQLSYPGSIH